MNCSEIAPKRAAYVDGELDEEVRRAVEAHLEECPDCRRQIERERALKHRLAGLEGRREPPEAVRAQIESHRFDDDGASPSRDEAASSTWRRSAGWVAAVLLAVTAVGVWYVERRRARSDLEEFASTLVADHEHSIPEKRPAEVASNDPERVRQFFEGRLGFEPVVPVLREARLLGGRLCTIRKRRVQLLFYEVGDRTMSLYVSDRPHAPERCLRRDGHSICFDHRDRYAFIGVGALEPDALRTRLASISSP